MKQILTSLFAVYSATNGQQPAVVTPQLPIVNPPLTAATTSAPGASTTTAAAQPSTTQTQQLPPPPPLVPPAAPQTTGAAATAPATTTASSTTTEAPYYVNPFCPAAYAISQLGVPNPVPSPPTVNAECRSNVPGDPLSKAMDYEGTLLCANWACCLCQEIYCGASGGAGCDYLKLGDSAAIGVQNIIVLGTSGAGSNGAHVECSGLESCKGANIEGTDVGVFDCTGEHSCEGAQIEFTPAEGMVMECSGLRSCAGAALEIVVEAHAPISRIGSIQFNGQESAESAIVQIQNLGTEPLIIENFECSHPTACVGIAFEFVGNIQVQQCEMLGITDFTGFPEAIRTCMFGPSTTAVPAASTTAAVPQPPATTAGQIPPQTTAQQPVAPGTTATFSVQPINPTQPQQPRSTQSSTTVPVAGHYRHSSGYYTSSGHANEQHYAGTDHSSADHSSTNYAGTNSSTTPNPTPAPTNPAPTTPNPTLPPVLPVTDPLLPPVVVEKPGELKCTEATCASRSVTFTPSNSFVLECQGDNGCGGMTLNMNVWYDPITPGNMVTNINGFKFVGRAAGAGVTININNGLYGLWKTQVSVNEILAVGRAAGAGVTININNGLYGLWKTQVSVNEILCQGEYACDGLTINAGIGVNVFNTKVSCVLPGACDRCVVVTGSTTNSCLDIANGNAQYSGHTQTYGAPQPPVPSLSLYQQYQQLGYPYGSQLV
eukprot:CAMPEP_0197073678 /NCGR_PEP_ID=MMETSP1384-20130603/210723_1 /TAXON_ID=29189 /ORGANISM="Ammonia sp." /LENGTH=714 /DNA_ID=CAMNT_0042512517 /DNA_START=147 /DNA_END=2293 /DNA_ORIENTATION=+